MRSCEKMLLYKALAINILFSIVCLSSIGNDDKSMNAEHGFVPSHATNNNIVSDVNQGQSKHQKSITDSFALKKNSSLELYNLTEQAKKLNLTAEWENLRLFGKTIELFWRNFSGSFSINFVKKFCLVSDFVKMFVSYLRGQSFVKKLVSI